MSDDKKWLNCSIPILLSDHVETMEDWELVEYASRYEATSKYYRNGATEAKIKEVMRVWCGRYHEEDIIILECASPLEYHTCGSIDDYFKEHKVEETDGEDDE
jgi:UDP-2,3-diacylglucosamine pyrophosphatase LpxH